MHLRQGRVRRLASFGTAFVLLAAVTGCGKGKVSGTVKGPDGRPLPLGRIIFIPASGPGVTTGVEDGKYAAEGVPPGDVKVALETKYIKDNAQTSLASLQGGGAPMGPPMPTTGQGLPPGAAAQIEEMNHNRTAGLDHAKEQLAKYREIPEKYTKPDTSGLSLTVKSGNNSFDVDLSK